MNIGTNFGPVAGYRPKSPTSRKEREKWGTLPRAPQRYLPVLPGLVFLWLRAEQGPGFAVALVVVAAYPDALHRAEHQAFADPVENEASRDEIPGILGHDVDGEKIDIVERVRALRATSQVAEISRALAVGSGFHLDPHDAGAEIEGDVEGGGFAPGRQHLEAMADGLDHEHQLDPLAALLETLEELVFVHLAPILYRGKRKGATHGPRLVLQMCLPKVLAYMYIISYRRG